MYKKKQVTDLLKENKSKFWLMGKTQKKEKKSILIRNFGKWVLE